VRLLLLKVAPARHEGGGPGLDLGAGPRVGDVVVGVPRTGSQRATRDAFNAGNELRVRMADIVVE
jgi:hypothetical protein